MNTQRLGFSRRNRETPHSPAGRIMSMVAVAGLALLGLIASPQLAAAAGATYPDQLVATIPMSGNPYVVAAAPDGAHVYVSNDADGSVLAIDTATNAVTQILPPGSGSRGLAVSLDSKYLYSAGNSDVTVVDTTSPSATPETILVGAGPQSIVVSPDGAYLYVAVFGNDSVSVIDTSSNTVIEDVPVVGGPTGVTITPDGGYVYVTNNGGSGNSVSVIDTSDNSLVDTIPVGNSPYGIVASPDGDYVYVVNQWQGNGSVSVIDTVTNTVVDTITDSSFNAPIGAAITPDGAYLYVMNQDTSPGKVSVIDTSNNTVIDVLTVGNNPGFAVFSPDGAKAYVTNYNYTDSTGGSVSVLSMPQKTVTFNANGGTGTMADQTAAGTTSLHSNSFVRNGYVFKGWATKATGPVAYTDGAPFAFASNATLYAVWWTQDATNALTVTPGGTVTGQPGETVDVVFDVINNTTTNYGQGINIVDGMVDANGWVRSLSPAVPPLTLPAGSTTTFTLSVTIPTNAQAGDARTVSLEASVGSNQNPIASNTGVVKVSSSSGPSLSISLGSVPVNGVQTVNATGFVEGETVTAVMYSTPFNIGTKTVGPGGAVTFTWKIPAGTAPGVHTVTLTGSVSGPISVQFLVTDGTELPNTGFDAVPTLAVAALTLGSGALLLLSARRRRG